MTKKEFILELDKEQTIENKLNLLQFFLDNFPVIITDPFRGYQTKTQLQGIKITGGGEEIINYSFHALQQRKNELNQMI